MTFARVKLGGWVNEVDTIDPEQINALDINVTNSVDGRGGNYTPSSKIRIDNGGGANAIESDDAVFDGTVLMSGTETVSGMLALTGILSASVGSSIRFVPGAAIADVTDQTLTPANGLIQRFTATAAAVKNHDLVAAGTAGRMFFLVNPAASAGNIVIRRAGFAGNDIVTMPSGSWEFVCLYDDGANWRLLAHINCTPGPDA